MKKLLTVFLINIFLFSFLSISYSHIKADLSNVLIIDESTNVTLRDENFEKIIEPASFTKLMTIAVVLKNLHDNKINLNQSVNITHDIWTKGGAPSGTSTMFAALNSDVLVSDLLKGLIIDSANDAAIALAKLIAGTENDFTKLMNIEAQKIGLKNSYFVNATGLPETQATSKTTLKDIVILLKYLRKNYPNYIELSKQPNFTWNKINQLNKNFLLKKNNDDIIGLSGITAYNKTDKFMFAGCAQKNGRVVYVAFTNALSNQQRIKTSYDLLNWAYNNFNLNILFSKGTEVVKIPVFAGAQSEISAIAKNNIYGLESKIDKDFTQLKVKYKIPLIAPINKNQEIGLVSVYSKNQFMSSNALVAQNEILPNSFFKKFKSALYQITIGWFTNLMYYKLNNI